MKFRVISLCLLTLMLAACGGNPTPAPAPIEVEAQSANETPVEQANIEAPPGTDVAVVSNPDQPQQALPSPTPAVATPGTQVDAVAMVNGEAITTEKFERSLQRRQSELNASDEDALANFVLTTLINQKLTEQSAIRLDITVTEEEIDAEIAALKELIEGDESAWQQWLADNLYTEAEFRDELRSQLIAGHVRDVVVGDVVNQNQRQVHARHILVETEAQATEIRTRLLNGESFVTLAAQFSRDITTKDQGGDLGWFAPDELLEPKVSEVAFAQPAGAISQPVATRLGYHIIQTLEFDELPLPPEKQAQVAQVVFDEWLTTQNDSSIIEVYR